MDRFEFGADKTTDRRPEDLLNEILTEISPFDREILTRFYLKGQTPAQIRSEMGVSIERLCTLKARVRNRFREMTSPVSPRQLKSDE
jgi:hypothetical protein